jgi:hypothetical protein
MLVWFLKNKQTRARSQQLSLHGRVAVDADVVRAWQPLTLTHLPIVRFWECVALSFDTYSLMV